MPDRTRRPEPAQPTAAGSVASGARCARGSMARCEPGLQHRGGHVAAAALQHARQLVERPAQAVGEGVGVVASGTTRRRRPWSAQVLPARPGPARRRSSRLRRSSLAASHRPRIHAVGSTPTSSRRRAPGAGTAGHQGDGEAGLGVLLLGVVEEPAVGHRPGRRQRPLGGAQRGLGLAQADLDVVVHVPCRTGRPRSRSVSGAGRGRAARARGRPSPTRMRAVGTAGASARAGRGGGSLSGSLSGSASGGAAHGEHRGRLGRGAASGRTLATRSIGELHLEQGVDVGAEGAGEARKSRVTSVPPKATASRKVKRGGAEQADQHVAATALGVAAVHGRRGSGGRRRARPVGAGAQRGAGGGALEGGELRRNDTTELSGPAVRRLRTSGGTRTTAHTTAKMTSTSIVTFSRPAFPVGTVPTGRRRAVDGAVRVVGGRVRRQPARPGRPGDGAAAVVTVLLRTGRRHRHGPDGGSIGRCQRPEVELGVGRLRAGTCPSGRRSSPTGRCRRWSSSGRPTCTCRRW